MLNVGRIVRICALVGPFVFFAPVALSAQEGGDDCAECEGINECFLGCELENPGDCGPCTSDDESCWYVPSGCGEAMIGLDGAVYVRSAAEQAGTDLSPAASLRAPATLEVSTPQGGSVLVRRCDNIVISRLYPAGQHDAIIAALRRFVL